MPDYWEAFLHASLDKLAAGCGVTVKTRGPHGQEGTTTKSEEWGKNAMEYVRSIPEIKALMQDADYVDCYSTISNKSLRAMVASCLSFMPGWARALYWLRAGLVRLLGMRQEKIPFDTPVREEDVSLTPGDRVEFFTVAMARDESYWVGGATEKHLSGNIGIVAEALQDGRKRFHLLTVVKYRHWTGPVYFNIIRPFHHFIVKAMLKDAVKDEKI
jgi:hypothetical protein